MIINSDMNILPTPALGLLAAAITIHAMANAAETGQFFDVEMEQIAGCGMLVAL